MIKVYMKDGQEILINGQTGGYEPITQAPVERINVGMQLVIREDGSYSKIVAAFDTANVRGFSVVNEIEAEANDDKPKVDQGYLRSLRNAVLLSGRKAV